jgi:hypothetical protein
LEIGTFGEVDGEHLHTVFSQARNRRSPEAA